MNTRSFMHPKALQGWHAVVQSRNDQRGQTPLNSNQGTLRSGSGAPGGSGNDTRANAVTPAGALAVLASLAGGKTPTASMSRRNDSVVFTLAPNSSVSAGELAVKAKAAGGVQSGRDTVEVDVDFARGRAEPSSPGADGPHPRGHVIINTATGEITITKISMAYGGGGNDRLANSGNDRLSGGSGNDRLAGGSGADRLRGESGSDSRRDNSGNDRPVGGGVPGSRMSANEAAASGALKTIANTPNTSPPTDTWTQTALRNATVDLQNRSLSIPGYPLRLSNGKILPVNLSIKNNELTIGRYIFAGLVLDF